MVLWLKKVFGVVNDLNVLQVFRGSGGLWFFVWFQGFWWV